MLRKTNAPAILVECAFVDDKDDADHWDADKCGDAIASAIAGKPVAGTTSGGSAPAAAPASQPVTNVFDKENWIHRLQSECNAQGFSNQRVDGIPGKNTLAGCPELGRTSKGNITALAQEYLQALGYYRGKVDGINGKLTQEAIKGFQRDHNLLVDGIVGQNTWRALLGL